MRGFSISALYALPLLLAVASCSSSATKELRPSASEDRRLLLTLPDLPWAVEIHSEGFKVVTRKTMFDERKAMFLAANPRYNLNVSMFLEPTSLGGGAKECREYYFTREQKSPTRKDHVRTWEEGDSAMAEYVADIPELNAKQKHLHVYLAKDGMWVDVHLSLHRWSGDDRLLLEAAKAVQFLSYTHESVEYLEAGSQFYLKKNWAKAIENLKEALELEKKSRQLSQVYWRVLADNLGMAYGISGDLARAKETFEYAISQDPQYPMFHYNLACTEAEMGNLDPALNLLKCAFSLRANLNPTEKMPDPTKDSSFRAYLQDPKFVACVNELKK